MCIVLLRAMKTTDLLEGFVKGQIMKQFKQNHLKNKQ